MPPSEFLTTVDPSNAGAPASLPEEVSSPSQLSLPKAKQELSKVKYTNFVSTSGSAPAPYVWDFEFENGWQLHAFLYKKR